LGGDSQESYNDVPIFRPYDEVFLNCLLTGGQDILRRAPEFQIVGELIIPDTGLARASPVSGRRL
jgi:hypothetical protein